MRTVTIEVAIAVNQRVTHTYGGLHGVRDPERLEAAINRVYSGYFTSPIQQAVVILQSIAHDHPFHDGNKRTAYVLMQSILFSVGLRLAATQDEKVGLVISAVEGSELKELFLWVTKRIEVIGWH